MTITFPDVHGCDEVYMDCLELLTGTNRKSMIDLGCNLAPHTRKLGFKEKLYVDVLYRDIQEEQPYFLQADILNMPKEIAVERDASFCLDCIEHISKSAGWDLLYWMRIFSKRQILFTPLDEWMMTTDDNKDPEAHRSLWRPEELPDYWFKIVFPVYHPTLNIGAHFFAGGISLQEQEQIATILSKKGWATNREVKP